MNCPMIPGIQIKGTKAATVVIVAVVTGIITSRVPSMAASTRPFPMAMWR